MLYKARKEIIVKKLLCLLLIFTLIFIVLILQVLALLYLRIFHSFSFTKKDVEKGREDTCIHLPNSAINLTLYTP